MLILSVASAETMGASNMGFDTVNKRRPTRLGGKALPRPGLGFRVYRVCLGFRVSGLGLGIRVKGLYRPTRRGGEALPSLHMFIHHLLLPADQVHEILARHVLLVLHRVAGSLRTSTRQISDKPAGLTSRLNAHTGPRRSRGSRFNVGRVLVLKHPQVRARVSLRTSTQTRSECDLSSG